MNQTQSSNIIDPFEEQSILSLNPRTFRLSQDAMKSKDLEAIHQHMKSMALKSPDKHFEKAKSVIDSGLELHKTKKSETDIEENENPQQRRPALVRKRAKFSMKPDISQSSTILEPTFDINQYQNSEEYFAAYEKFENTKKELKRQRGEDVDEVKDCITARQRRPEIPRRKVSYKHYEYSSQSQDDTLVSQETLQDNIGSPPTRCSQEESLTPNGQCEEEEVTGSIAKSENRVDRLYDELMTSGIDKLDGNQAVSFLKDRMKIKPVDINDLQLPEFHKAPRVDFISPVKNLLEDYQSILSDTCVLPDITKGKTLGTQKRLSGNPLQSLGSPTPPKSPFSAISTFGKSLLQSVVSRDPFSAHDVNSPLPTTSTEIIGGGSSHVSKDKQFPVSATLQSLAKNILTETAIGDMEDREHNMEERDAYDNVTDMKGRDHNTEERGADDNVTNIRTNKDINVNAEDLVQTAVSVTEVNLNGEDITEENVADVTEKEGSATLQEVTVEVSDVEDLGQPAQTDANSIEDLDASGPAQNLDIDPEPQNEEHPRTKTNKKKKIACKIDPKKPRHILAAQTDANSIEDLDANGPAQNLDIDPEPQNEEHPRTKTNKKKTITRKIDPKKHRQSLAGAGSSWTSGVRRSSRNRRRPLEFWKGERLLYGRVHNSLPTVIGVKYISPSKAGFTVESFVSDEHKHLVDFAALH